MPASIPETHRDLLTRPALAHLVTLMPDGSPQVTPVWCDMDDGHVRVIYRIAPERFSQMG